MVVLGNEVVVYCYPDLKPDLADFSHIFFWEDKTVRSQDEE